MKNIIEVKNLNKTYPNFKIDNVSLNIPKGSIIGLVRVKMEPAKIKL